MKVGRLLLRAVVGGLFVGHGTQKLFGWFNGHGLKNTAAAFESMGMHPGLPNAVAAGVAEAGGGAGLALGFQTPLASSALIATMLTAIHRVHGKNGPWVTQGGYEYNAVLIAVAVLLAELGPGPLSLDALRGKERSGLVWGLAAVGLGAAGAAGANLVADSLAPKDLPAPPSTAASAPAQAAAPASAATDSAAVSAAD